MSLRSESCTNLEMHIYDFWETLYDSSSRADIKQKKTDALKLFQDWLNINKKIQQNNIQLLKRKWRKIWITVIVQGDI